MYPVWVLLTDNRILEGWIGANVAAYVLGGNRLSEGDNLQLVIDEKHNPLGDEVLPVKDVWLRIV